MVAIFAFAILAASAGSLPLPSGAAMETPAAGSPFTASTGAKASASVSVRILSGSRVRLGQSADGDPAAWVISSTRVHDETGAVRVAKLVEFQ